VLSEFIARVASAAGGVDAAAAQQNDYADAMSRGEELLNSVTEWDDQTKQLGSQLFSMAFHR
jgi:hypothetical protein